MKMMIMMTSLCKTQCQIKPCKCLLRTALAYSAPGALYNDDANADYTGSGWKRNIMMTMVTPNIL